MHVVRSDGVLGPRRGSRMCSRVITLPVAVHAASWHSFALWAALATSSLLLAPVVVELLRRPGAKGLGPWVAFGALALRVALAPWVALAPSCFGSLWRPGLLVAPFCIGLLRRPGLLWRPSVSGCVGALGCFGALLVFSLPLYHHLTT